MNLSQAEELISTYTQDLIDICPHCGSKAHIEKLYHDHHTLKNNDVEFFVIFRCKPCKRLLLKTFLFNQNQYSNVPLLTEGGWSKKFPSVLDSEINQDDMAMIPKNIVEDYKEALECSSIKAIRASCTMLRRTLQSSLLELGAKETDDLIVQINSLENLPKDIKDWAHQIRIFGNWGSHPDKDNLKEITPEDAEDAKDFTSKFLTFAFIMPAKVATTRARRDKKINEQK